MAGKWRLTVVGVRRHPGRVWDVGSRQGATNTMSGVSLPACQAKVGPVWQPLAPQSHLGWALPVLFGGVRETLLPSAPSPGTNLGADMQGGQGQIHYRYTTIVLTTKYKCTTDHDNLRIRYKYSDIYTYKERGQGQRGRLLLG